jgi:hypothetical protein
MSQAIEVNALGKRFGKVTAVDGVSFTVAAREIFGFKRSRPARSSASWGTTAPARPRRCACSWA